MQLRGRVALVTGAARRVGRAIALRLAAAGCDVAVHYATSRADAERTAGECAAAGVRAVAVRADLAEADACAALARDVLARLGRLDVLVNNASIFEPMTLEEFDVARWERTLRVNLTAPLLLAHAAAGALRASRGRVVNLCDVAVERPWADHLAYIVSKGALQTLTRTLAVAFAPEVNVCGVAPGVAAWPDHYDDETRRRLTNRIPLRRAGTPEEVAAAVHFLLESGDYVTGAILPVDGGRRLA